jgi:acetate kinase
VNYAHIAGVLPELLGAKANGRVVVAHLGSSQPVPAGKPEVGGHHGYTRRGIVMGSAAATSTPG